MSARAFLRDLRHYSSYVIDQAALGVFQACAIAVDRLMDSSAPVDGSRFRVRQEALVAAGKLTEAEAEIEVWEPGRGDGDDQQDGTESSSGAAPENPAGDQGSTESEWLGNSEPTDPASPAAQQQRIAWRLHNAGLTSPQLAAVRDALVDEGLSAVNVDDAEFSPGAVSVPPTPPAPGRPNPPPASAPAAHHRVAGGNSPGAVSDTPLSPAPGPPTTWLLLDAANQLALWRDGARMTDRRRDRLAELISEMHARVDELDGLGAAKDAAFTTVVEQHAEALRHLD